MNTKQLSWRELKALSQLDIPPMLPPAVKEGVASVATTREDGPLSIEYKLFGRGPTKLLVGATPFISGHGGQMSEFGRYVKHFGGRDNEDKYSSLLINNRGIGKSEIKWHHFTIDDMATDVMEVLDEVRWSEPKSVNVVGHSMGGMIAQKLVGAPPELLLYAKTVLALLCNRIATLTLVSTASSWASDWSLWSVVSAGLSTGLLPTPDGMLKKAKATQFGKTWIYLRDEAREEGENVEFSSNGDRFAAQFLLPGLPVKAAFLQTPAIMGFNMTRNNLKTIGDTVGQDRIQIIHGEVDVQLRVQSAKRLHAGIFADEKASGLHIFPDAGHMITFERHSEILSLVENILR